MRIALFRKLFPKRHRYRIETERFVLEIVDPWKFARATHRWTDDEEVMGGIGLKAGGWPLRRWRRRFTDHLKSKTLTFSIVPKGSETPIGYHSAVLQEEQTAMLSVVVGDRAWWGKDVVVEVRGGVIDFLFDKLRVERVWGMPNQRNFPSIYNYMRLGFTHEATFRKATTRYGAGRTDMLSFGLLKSEWKEKRSHAK